MREWIDRNSRWLIPVLSGLAFPVFWLLLLVTVTITLTTIPSLFWAACIVSAFAGGTIAAIAQVSGEMGNKAIVQNSKWLLGALLPAIAMIIGLIGPAVASTGSHPPPIQTGGQYPRLTKDEVNYELFRIPQRNNWEIIPTPVLSKPLLSEYEVGGIGKGPEQYTFLNLAKLKGCKLVIEWPDHPGYNKYSMEMKGSIGGEWKYLETKRFFHIDSTYNQVFLKGSAESDPRHPFKVTLTVEGADNLTRTATSRRGAENEPLLWGPLPLEIKGKPIQWELHIQCSHPNGMEISDKALREYPWGVQIGSGREDGHTLTSPIFRATSKEVEKPGDLIIGCPSIPGGVLMEVIVLVTDY